MVGARVLPALSRTSHVIQVVRCGSVEASALRLRVLLAAHLGTGDVAQPVGLSGGWGGCRRRIRTQSCSRSLPGS